MATSRLFQLLSGAAVGGAVAALLFASLPAAGQATSPRQRVSFNAEWRFHKGDPNGIGDALSYPKIKAALLSSAPATTGSDVAFVRPGYDDGDWRRLDLPHDWGVEGDFDINLPGETGKLPWHGIGWYRKRFVLPQSDRGRRVTLEVDGAMSYATVWLNGHFVGGWPYGYGAWSVDLTPFAEVGKENVLAIRLDNPPDSSRWYPGGGIYRNVWLTKTNPVHVAHWGTQVTTEVAGTTAQVTAKTTLRNNDSAARGVKLVSTVLDARFKPVAKAETNVTLAPGASQVVNAQLTVANAHLWTLQSPRQYTLVSEIRQGGKVLDRYQTGFGIRTIRWDVNQGFLLNGEKVPLNGVCLHHDLGALGAAWNTRAAERQLEIMKNMGVNAIRTSHNPPAPEFLDLCDRMGLLVIDEFSDTWKTPKKPNGYTVLWDDWAERDLRAMLRRDRNHPSIIAWSIGNEVDEQSDGEGKAARFLAAICRAEDPTRPTTSGNNYTHAAYNGFQNATDVFGFNYKPWEYGTFREKNSPIPVYGSETSSCVSSRGEYKFPVENDKAKGEFNFQVSSYDLYAPPWAWPPDVEFEGLDKFPFAAGEFVWTGFDYLGEPTPYNADLTVLNNFTDPAQKAKAEAELAARGKIASPARSSYFGIVDLAGFPKDRYYLYQSRWRPDWPLAHILPHWNWPERVGQVTPVHVYTPGDEAELFVNGVSQGRRKKEPLEYRLRWDDVIYAPGEVRVVTYKNGKKSTESWVRTTGEPAKVLLEPDRAVIKSDGSDLSFVTVRIADKDGQTVPRSSNPLRFTLTGPGEIVATDNGNAIDLIAFRSHERQAYNGLALVIIRAKKGVAGKITVRAEADGLARGEAVITASKSTQVRDILEAHARGDGHRGFRTTNGNYYEGYFYVDEEKDVIHFTSGGPLGGWDEDFPFSAIDLKTLVPPLEWSPDGAPQPGN